MSADVRTEQGTEKLGGVLQRMPRPTPGCSVFWKKGSSSSYLSHENLSQDINPMHSKCGVTPNVNKAVNDVLTV
jgi:hypothetical protein